MATVGNGSFHAGACGMEADRDVKGGDSHSAPPRASRVSPLVLDASVVCDWLLGDELDPRAARVVERVPEVGTLVPQLWHLEVRNALISAERRGRITSQGLSDRLRALRRLPVSTDAAPNLDDVVVLARAHGLSAYDAVYLELAQRSGAVLATLDTRLAQAAAAADVPTIE